MVRHRRRHLGAGALLFAEVARLEFATRQYPDDLWRSAESCLQGHDFRSAVATFEEYLKYESRRRRPDSGRGTTCS